MIDDAVAHLRRMIQIDTTNPPGNELPLAKYIERTLSAAGVETQLFEPVTGRAHLIGRLRGDGSAPPILITAHMDVVGVERESWSVDPFGGEIRHGALYGRGAIDDKGMLAANLAAMLAAKRDVDAGRLRLRRDVIFAATSDEETGGAYGLGWMIANHPDAIRAEYALNEGGRIRIVDGKPLYAAVQTTEKAAHVVTITAHGPSGHASVPLAGNAVARLARAVAIVTAHQEPVRLIPTVREFFARLSAIWPEANVAAAMRDVGADDKSVAERGYAELCRLPMYNAVLRTGISATVMSAGMRHNVIPAEATATLSVRTLPRDSIDDVVHRLQAMVADDAVTIAVTSRGTDAPASDHQSPMFAAIRDAVTSLDPSIVTVPYMSTGATESAQLRAWGVQTFGLLPFPLDADDESRMHGNDERVPLNSLEFGTRLVFDVVRRMAVIPSEARNLTSW
ncbi:MAG TPA: M20/M25/M40 family metallo-hydrolase [Gemmatimonadaceae bacterium]|nr:M20/M25/M40 family metallo-hydrolase [Gemmatimonadaceae bacterium]